MRSAAPHATIAQLEINRNDIVVVVVVRIKLINDLFSYEQKHVQAF